MIKERTFYKNIKEILNSEYAFGPYQEGELRACMKGKRDYNEIRKILLLNLFDNNLENCEGDVDVSLYNKIQECIEYCVYKSELK